MTRFFKNWLPVFLWAGLIFFLSSQPDLKLEAAGGFDFFLRKLAHMTEFGVLFLLIHRAFLAQSFNKKTAALIAVLFSVLYAISDEHHQSFVIGRVASLVDVGIDTLGILFATFLVTKGK